MRNSRLDELQTGIKIGKENSKNLRYVDNTTLMAESTGKQWVPFTQLLHMISLVSRISNMITHSPPGKLAQVRHIDCLITNIECGSEDYGRNPLVPVPSA